LADHLFRAFFHSIQLVLPVALEGSGPFVQGPYGVRIGAVKFLATLATHPYEAHVAQYL
jgi:hypothetical protein